MSCVTRCHNQHLIVRSANIYRIVSRIRPNRPATIYYTRYILANTRSHESIAHSPCLPYIRISLPVDNTISTRLGDRKRRMAEGIATSTITALLPSPTDETAAATTPTSPEQAPPNEKIHPSHLPQRQNSHWLLFVVVSSSYLALKSPIARAPRPVQLTDPSTFHAARNRRTLARRCHASYLSQDPSLAQQLVCEKASSSASTGAGLCCCGCGRYCGRFGESSTICEKWRTWGGRGCGVG